MKKLKVGIIGSGMALEKLHYPAYQKLTDHYEIVALCDVDKEKAQQWAGTLHLDTGSVYTDWREMIKRDDLDVVDIMVPIDKNFEVTEAVASRLANQKKGIICEKPLAPTLAQAEAARELPKKYNIPILIAENYRYNQEFAIIKDMVQSKRIGDVYYFMQNRVVDFPLDMIKDRFPAREWRQYPDFPGGAITDTALHDLAALRHIFGAIDKLQAFGRLQKADYSPYSVVNVNLLFMSGLTGQFSFFCAGKEMQRPLVGLRIIGTQGMIFLEERDCGTVNVAYNDGRSEQVPYQAQQGYYNELLNFYNALTGTEPIGVTSEMEFGDLRTVDAILKSIKEERIVEVDGQPNFVPNYQAPRTDQPRFWQ